MNITSRGARRTLAAVCSTAVVVAGAAFFVAPAEAAGPTLGFLPTVGSATILNLDPTTAGNEADTYGLKVTTPLSSDTSPLFVSVASGPTGGALYVERTNVGGAGAPPVAQPVGAVNAKTVTTGVNASQLTVVAGPLGATLNSHTVQVGTGATAEIAVIVSGGTAGPLVLDRPLSFTHTGEALKDLGLTSAADPYSTVGVGLTAPVTNYATGDNIYLGATKAGSYSLTFFRDRNGNGAYDSGTDDTTPAFPLTVLDADGTSTTATSDDFAPTLTVPASVDKPRTIKAQVSPGGLSTTDIRGLASGVGALGTALQSVVKVAFTQTANAELGGSQVLGVTVFDGTTFNRTSNATAAAGTVTTTSAAPTTTVASKTTAVVTNTTNTLALSSADDAVNVLLPNAAGTANTADVRAGTAEVVYKARALDAGSLAVAGATVYFTLAPVAGGTIALTNLMANHVAVPATGEVAVTTDADGYATLSVHSDLTAAGNKYQITATTNGHSDNAVVTYQATAARTTNPIVITSSAAELSPAVGTANVTIKGKLVDQFGQIWQPPNTVTQQVTVGGVATGNAVLSAGTFSYLYTPATAPTAGTTQNVTFVYNGGAAATAAVNWASAASPATVTLSQPVNNATALVLSHANLIQSNHVLGSVLDSNSAGIAFKSYTLSAPADSGIYFAGDTAGTNMSNPFTGAATNAGGIDAYAFYTKVGSAKITATSGAAHAESAITTAAPVGASQYKIIVMGASGKPGQTLIVSGKVMDVFGNGVPDRFVSLSVGATSIGALTSATPQTNADGVFSTTFPTGSNQSGEVTVTANLLQAAGHLASDPKLVVVPTPLTTWKTVAGMTLANGDVEDTAKITVSDDVDKTTVSAASSRSGAGAVKLTGTAKPGSSVEVYSKPAGTSVAYALVGVATANAEGAWTDTEYINSTTLFYAKTSVSSSAPITVKVAVPEAPPTPKFNLGAKALGSGKVAITAVGNGDTRSVVTIYQVVGKKTVKVTTVKVDSKGVARATIKTSKGSKTYKVVYINGYKNGSKTIKVTVK
jgi:hypothetical protein